MWDLPGSGVESVSPELAGGLVVIGPPGKPWSSYLVNFLGSHENAWELFQTTSLRPPLEAEAAGGPPPKGQDRKEQGKGRVQNQTKPQNSSSSCGNVVLSPLFNNRIIKVIQIFIIGVPVVRRLWRDMKAMITQKYLFMDIHHKSHKALFGSVFWWLGYYKHLTGQCRLCKSISKSNFKSCKRSWRWSWKIAEIIAMKNRGMTEVHQLTTGKIKNQQR